MASAAPPPAAAAAPVDALQYAEQLRKGLMKELFDGEETSDAVHDEDDDGDFLIDVSTGSQLSLGDLDKQIEEYHEHEVIKAILDKGMVIKEYATDIDNKLRQVELESIQDYIQESDNLVGLHEQIKNCDAILSHMEQMLGRFQGDLGKVSEEIRQLQVQSQTMSMKLKNRRAAENKLGNFVNQVTVPEDLVTNIFEAEVSEDYLEYLLTLDQKLRFIGDDDLAKVSAARRDVEPALEKLRVKAITRVREFLLQKIYTLKRPKTNIQIIQQNVLLKYKYFIRFLRKHGKDIYDEVRSEYVNVLGKIYASHFRSYLSSMERMQQAVGTQADVIGVSDAPTGVNNMLSLFGKVTQLRSNTEAVFELGDRAAILAQVKEMPMIPHMAEYEGKKFPYEVIFRNIHKLLLDTATSEFFFCLDFFEDEGVFRDVCQPIITIVEGDLANATQEQADMVGICLMIRLNHEHRRMMVKRRVPCLDDYLDRINLMLWPRFKVLLDNQMGSIRAGAEQRLFTGDVAVHSVARRYAALCSSLLLLMNEHEQEDAGGAFQASSFHDMMDRLWAAMFDLMLRMSNMFRDRRQGIIFLILNYNHILTVLKGTDTSAEKGQPAAAAATASSPRSPSSSGGGLGSHGASAIKDCRDQLSSCTQLYVEDQLGGHFRDLVDFVKKAEQQQKRMAVPEGAAIPGYGPAEASPVLRDFSSRWTAAIEAMAKEVARGFPDAACGREVLQASMTQLLLYYSRALELLKKQGPAGQAVVKEAVNIPSIMYEIKRITKT